MGALYWTFANASMSLNLEIILVLVRNMRIRARDVTLVGFGYRVLESTRMIQTQEEFFTSLIRAVVRDFDFEL